MGNNKRRGFNLGDAREVKSLKAAMAAAGKSDGDDSDDTNFEELSTLSAVQQEQAADRQLEQEMAEEVVWDDDLHARCATALAYSSGADN